MHQKVKLGLNSPGKSITKMLCQTCVEQGKPASTLLQHTAIIRLEIQCSVAFQKGAHAVGSCLLHSIGQVQMLVTESHQNRNELPCFCTLGLQLWCTGSIFSDHGLCKGGQPIRGDTLVLVLLQNLLVKRFSSFCSVSSLDSTKVL